MRGDFEEKVVYKNLNVNPRDFTFNLDANLDNKTLLFLAGMPGSGKTSELKKYVKNLDRPECFFTITCNIDRDLDTNDLEYMDILIFQLEKLVDKANEHKIKLNEEVIASIVLESGSEMKLLLRSLRPEIFRLIIVQHNHRKVIDQVVEQIQYKYPDRSLSRIQVESKNYRELMDAIYRQRKGILIIEDFYKILDKPEVYVAFNQRRDKIAQYPIALICFIPTGNEVLQECIKKIPDFWSFRNLLVKLEWKQPLEYNLERQEQSKEISTIGGTNIYGKEEELNRLIARVDELQPVSDNLSLINSYYPQILQLLEEIGAYQKGLEYAERFMKIAQENHYAQNLPSVYSDAITWKAKFYQYLGHYAQARDLFEEALASDLANYGEKHPAVAASQSNLGLVYKDLGEYKKAGDLLEKALEVATASYGDQHPAVAKSQSNLALVYKDLGEYEKARDLLEKALVSDIHNYGNQHPTVAVRQSNLATVYQALGEYEKARDFLEKALASDIANHGEKHPAVALSQSNLATVYRNLGEYEKARGLLERALASDIANYGDQHPTVARHQSNLALVYKDLGKYEKARDLLEKALALATASYREKHPNVAVSQSNLAAVYKDLGKYEKARDLLEKALASDIANYGEKHPTVAVRQSNLAAVYKDLGKYEKARELWKRAYAVFFHALGAGHPNTKTVKSFLDQMGGK